MIHFKSIEKMYEKEQSDVKNNTVRYVNMYEDKFLDLAAMVKNNEYGKICIHKSVEKDGKWVKTGEFFVRDIVDVTFWAKFCIITWRKA